MGEKEKTKFDKIIIDLYKEGSVLEMHKHWVKQIVEKALHVFG